jgi:hypothetical protein
MPKGVGSQQVAKLSYMVPIKGGVVGVITTTIVATTEVSTT